MIYFDREFKKNELEKEISNNNVIFEGEVGLRHYRNNRLLYKEVGKNRIVNEGLNHLLNVVFGATAKEATWYVGIFKGNITPAAGDTAALALGVGGTYTEAQDADYNVPLTNRPEYIDAPATAQVMTNTASPASFTMLATLAIYGAFLASSQAKTATTGVLGAAKRFDAVRNVVAADVLSVTYQITATSA